MNASAKIGRPPKDDEEKLKLFQLRATDSQVETWQAAADLAADGNRSQWVRDVLDRAAKRALRQG